MLKKAVQRSVRRESSNVKSFRGRALGSPTFRVSPFTILESAAGELALQFGLDRVEEGLHFKGLLKRAVGAQHFGDVES